MTSKTVAQLCASLLLAVTGAVLSAQSQPQPLLPSSPPKGFGASVSPAFEGWFDNPDGTHSFLIGYYNRNTGEQPDVPIGPNNHFEPGNPDMGQPTHFLNGRQYGMFVYTTPKEFTKTQRLTWVLTVNGVTQSVPFHMSPDYNITPQKSSEQGPGGYNMPPVLRFEEKGPTFQGPFANPIKGIAKTAALGTAMPLDLLVEDDGLWSTGTNAPMTGTIPPPVEMVVSKYRGAGTVTVADKAPKLTILKGGKPDQAFAGKGSTTVKFSEAGEYMLHVTANDFSGKGGGGSACCWTTAIVKVSVKGSGATPTGQQ